MVTTSLIVRLEAKEGQRGRARRIPRRCPTLVQAEPQTIAWFALQTGPSSFAIVDAFPNEEGRQAHLERSGCRRAARQSRRPARPAARDRAGRRARREAAMTTLTSSALAIADARRELAHRAAAESRSRSSGALATTRPASRSGSRD